MRMSISRDRDPAEVRSEETPASTFSEMTTSVVAVITDVVRDGKPSPGFAFNSTGRYACGAQMRARSFRASSKPIRSRW